MKLVAMTLDWMLNNKEVTLNMIRIVIYIAFYGLYRSMATLCKIR